MGLILTEKETRERFERDLAGLEFLESGFPYTGPYDFPVECIGREPTLSQLEIEANDMYDIIGLPALKGIKHLKFENILYNSGKISKLSDPLLEEEARQIYDIADMPRPLEKLFLNERKTYEDYTNSHP